MRRNSSRLPFPKYAAASNPARFLREPADDFEAQRLRELAQLRQRRLELDVAHAGPLHGRDDARFGFLVDILHHGGGAYQ